MVNRLHLKNDYFESPVRYADATIYQMGRLYCSAGYVVHTHAHLNWFEITVVSGGEGTITTNGTSVPVQKGDIYLSFPFDSHRIDSSINKPLEYDFFAFYPDLGELRTDYERLLTTNFMATDRIIHDGRINYLLGCAIAETENSEDYSSKALESIYAQIIIYIVRSFKKISVQSDRLKESAICNKIMNYIDTHVFTLNNLTELATVTNYNYSYISSIFKKTTNRSILDYYLDKKLSVAKLLIDEGQLKINQISDLLGYSSQFAFSKAFKNKYGISPKKYS